jgi:FdrA protein
VLGAAPPPGSAALWVETLDAAADAMVARLAHRPWTPAAFGDPASVRARLQALRSSRPAIGPEALGLYTGGTLAHEAHLLLKCLLGDTRVHRVLDLGDDRYTVGRPHPMIDPGTRSDLIVKAGDSPESGVLLVDLVLGRGAHPNPAFPLAEAVREGQRRASAAGRRLVTVGSIVGTAHDPQGLTAQRAQLEAAGIEVFPTNAEAARFAALLIKPELADVLPEGAS